MTSNKYKEDRVYDDFQEGLTSEQLTSALRSIKEHLGKAKLVSEESPKVDISKAE